MLTFDGFTIFIMTAILAPIIGAITLLFFFIFEKRIDLLENEKRKLELEKELKVSEFNQLNQQIQPHFLFNTLNIILSLARLRKTDELIKALEHFSIFLKFKYQINSQLIPIEQELKYTEHYLEIQKIRFGDRLTVQMECPDELRDKLIIPYLIQTLVENSFKHGLERKEGQALLHITISGGESKLSLKVWDNGYYGGGGLTSTSRHGQKGHGLDNLYQRLQLLFGKSGNLTICSGTEGGTVVLVEWPYH